MTYCEERFGPSRGLGSFDFSITVIFTTLFPLFTTSGLIDSASSAYFKPQNVLKIRLWEHVKIKEYNCVHYMNWRKHVCSYFLNNSCNVKVWSEYKNEMHFYLRTFQKLVVQRTLNYVNFYKKILIKMEDKKLE